MIHAATLTGKLAGWLELLRAAESQRRTIGRRQWRRAEKRGRRREALRHDRRLHADPREGEGRAGRVRVSRGRRIGVSEPVAILKSTKNPEAAKAFVDFLLVEGRTGSSPLEQGYIPPRPGCRLPAGYPERAMHQGACPSMPPRRSPTSRQQGKVRRRSSASRRTQVRRQRYRASQGRRVDPCRQPRGGSPGRGPRRVSRICAAVLLVIALLSLLPMVAAHPRCRRAGGEVDLRCLRRTPRQACRLRCGRPW